jgi:hypothetical protein
MFESAKKLYELQGKLNTENKKVVSDAIISLRNENPFKGAIGLLTDLFDITNDLIIKDLIRNFLNDIKEPEARSEIVTEMKKSFKHETICMLVSSCWQSGLDYSEYSVEFVNLFLYADYLTALECFTVIEEAATKLPVSKKNELIDLLENQRREFSADKGVLFRSLITTLG